MTFFDSIQTCFKKSFITTGTASRSEYFYFTAFVYLMTNSLLLLFLLTIIANLDALLEKEGILLFKSISLVFYQRIACFYQCNHTSIARHGQVGC